jgi:hypothetical protein
MLILVIICKRDVTTSKASRLLEVFSWRQMDFAYPSEEVRRFAKYTGDFIPANINPIGVAAAGSRVFITMPRWRVGVPATLATVQFTGNRTSSTSPLLEPYPDWSWNRLGNCEGITSVYRVKVDECGRVWVLDTGVAMSRRLCPAQVLAFDLITDKLLYRFPFPQVSRSFN